MRTFIQLQDGIGFAILQTPDGEPDHTVTPDNITAIEVTGESNPDQFLKKKYNTSTKTWTVPELYVWGVVDWEGTVIEVRRTYFEHEIDGPILPEDFKGNWKWKNNAWVMPEMPTHDSLGNPIAYLLPQEMPGYVEPEPLPTIREISPEEAEARARANGMWEE